MKKLCWITTCFTTSLLMACSTMDGGSYGPPPTYAYDNLQYYSQSYSVGADYGSYNYSQSRGEVTVPESYHVGAFRSPTPAKDSDKNWVSSQSPQGYTIEVADDEKPSAVAKKLYQIPKNDHTAEVKYQRNGKAYYKGLYGSYPSEEEAQKALNTLPDEVKQSAGVKNWGSVQNNISD